MPREPLKLGGAAWLGTSQQTLKVPSHHANLLNHFQAIGSECVTFLSNLRLSIFKFHSAGHHRPSRRKNHAADDPPTAARLCLANPSRYLRIAILPIGKRRFRNSVL